MKQVRTFLAAAAVFAVLSALGGCGILGCAGFATNGIGFGMCNMGMRF
jgi:hypothetical protein